MDNNEIVQQVMKELQKQSAAEQESPKASSDCNRTEFVGVGPGDTIGLVIANIDESLHESLGIEKKFHSLGIVGSRTGAGPQAMAADEAVKASNVEVIKFEMPRDTKGGGGHGSLVVFGAEEVSDAKRAVEITLKSLEWSFGGVTMNSAGHIEVQYTARASYMLEKYMGATLGKSWGLVCGCPASIGMVIADAAVKAADVSIVSAASPASGTSFTNEFMIMITGDSGAVKQAVIKAREIGNTLLSTLGEKPEPAAPVYF
ncbi:propanediol utilization microcompartment protein PduB [Caproiciproducens sp.]